MTEKPPEPHGFDRELARARLRQMEWALREGDSTAVRGVQDALEQGVLKLREPKRTPLQVAGGRARQAARAARSAADVTVTAVGTGAARAAEGVTTGAGKVDAAVRNGMSSAAGGLGATHQALTAWAGNLDWSALAPTEYAARFLSAGTRGIDRSLEQARLVWETIPEQLRALGPEEVAKRLDGFDWSHILPYSQGGGNDAANGIFELAGLNRARGAQPMTAAEFHAAEQVLSVVAFQAVLEEAASQVFTGGLAGAAVTCVLSSLELGLAYQRGEIARDEMYRRLGREAARSAAVGASVSGLMASHCPSPPSSLSRPR